MLDLGGQGVDRPHSSVAPRSDVTDSRILMLIFQCCVSMFTLGLVHQRRTRATEILENDHSLHEGVETGDQTLAQ